MHTRYSIAAELTCFWFLSYTECMDRLVLNPTSVSQWQALVKDAEGTAAVHLTEDIESYLVFLLMRFMGSPEVAQTVVADEFLAAWNQLGTQRLQTLKEIGDKCLLFSGLFPGRARKRRVRISYFVKLGQNAYLSLATQRHKEMARLFAELGGQFVGLMDILHNMRELEGKVYSLDLLQAEELWTDTQSPHALKSLRRMIHESAFYPGYLFPVNQKH